jgi:hypothetical protein
VDEINTEQLGDFDDADVRASCAPLAKAMTNAKKIRKSAPENVALKAIPGPPSYFDVLFSVI